MYVAKLLTVSIPQASRNKTYHICWTSVLNHLWEKLKTLKPKNIILPAAHFVNQLIFTQADLYCFTL